MSDVRANCVGVAPLNARLESWQAQLAADPDILAAWIAEHGSPVNLIQPEPLGRNAAELVQAAEDQAIPLRIFFARKANKALSLVNEAKRLGLGVDVASEGELRQVLDLGVEASDVVVTAAVKPRAMLEACVESGATIVLDNVDELALLREVRAHRDVRVAVRLAPQPASGRTPTRFGMGHDEILKAIHEAAGWPKVDGVHFHLDGYDPGDRVAAIAESLELVDALRDLGHEPRFVDIGGGIPMSYLESHDEWGGFWVEHGRATAGEREEITLDGHEIGTVYPYFQTPVRGEWLRKILGASLGASTVAEAIRMRELELRCEPGRALVDGCGMTVARVEFRKQRSDGTWLIGLAMNRTQMRSTSDDFLVDPLLLGPSMANEPSEACEGYLVGAYCIELELISWRRFSFPQGVAVGDLVAFPNTAGYLMHILESASHQIPLARNLVVNGNEAQLDPIDGSTAISPPSL